jgi:hypothetical protein
MKNSGFFVTFCMNLHTRRRSHAKKFGSSSARLIPKNQLQPPDVLGTGTVPYYRAMFLIRYQYQYQYQYAFTKAHATMPLPDSL